MQKAMAQLYLDEGRWDDLGLHLSEGLTTLGQLLLEEAIDLLSRAGARVNVELVALRRVWRCLASSDKLQDKL